MNLDKLKRHSRGRSTNMSPAAVSRRLDIVEELTEISQWLGKARRIHTQSEGEWRESSPSLQSNSLKI